MTNLETPDSVVAWLLGLAFGSPSLVVSAFLLLNALWAWWSLARDTAKLTSIIIDRSHDKYERRSFKYGATLRTAVGWACLYIPASYVTQIWAGSEFSPGQGGGLKELLQWSGAFGVLALLACFYLVPSRGPKFGDRHWAPLLGLVGGYMLGAAWAVYAFTLKNGPDPGDWWVCPAMSCVGVIGSCLRMRIKTIQSQTKGNGAPSTT